MFSLLIGKATFSSKLTYFRNGMIFYFSYVIGRENCRYEDILILVNKIVTSAFYISLLGFVMQFFTVDLWYFIGLKEVYIAKGTSQETFAVNGLPIRFFTSIGNLRFERMASILYEPVNLSYILSFALILWMFQSNHKNLNNILKGLTIALGVILTFGKGGMLIVGISIIYYFSTKYDLLKKLNKRTKRYLSILLITIMVVFVATVFNRNIGGSADAHFKSITNTLLNVLSRPLGFGLGSGGNYGVDNLQAYSSGQESGLMSLMYQMGIPFTILFIIDFIWMYKDSAKCYFKCPNNLLNISCVFPIAILLASLFQENTLGPQCCFLFMAFSGIVASRSKVSIRALIK